MQEDIERIFEIKSQSTNTHDESAERTTYLAKTTFILGISTVPMAIVSCLISQFVTYNPFLTGLNAVLFYLILIFTPISVLLGIAALIRILLSKKKRHGYGLTLIGMVLPVGSFAICFYFLLINMSWA
ncbi:MAG: hypothetical protein ACYSSP_03790 [Planctomycetota bacterium]|jgi:hypothetical protein